MGKINHFNIRVYAIIINEQNEILLSDEYVLDTYMTKFPGGGMQYGEGTIDCLKREALEEFSQEIEVLSHFYTTDFFQQALYFDTHQLISIYYKARFKKPPVFKISTKPFDFPSHINDSRSFRWKSLKELSEKDMTFPIDKHVTKLLK